MNTVEKLENQEKRWWMSRDFRTLGIGSAFYAWKNNSSLYTNLSDEEKQDYWNCFVFTMVWYHERGTDLPIDIAHLKDVYKSVETDLNRFLPGTMASLIEEGFSYDYDAVFTLDESAKHYLRVHSLTATNSQIVEGLVSQTEQQYIELAEKIGDLFYDALADVLRGISESASPEVSSSVLRASEHAQNAWEICKPYINEKTNPKHKTDIAGMGNKELGNRMGKLDNKTLKQFVKLLGEKLHRDGLDDEGRGRKKLATELFACSESLMEVSKIFL